MHLFSKSHYSKTLRKACVAAREHPGAEICGLIIDTSCHLSFIPTRNISKKTGSFTFSPPEIRRIVAAAKVLGQKIVGTFHSHPIGVATPGMTDIKNAVDDSLMFIFDCTSKQGNLWKIKNGRARQLPFGYFQNK
jgi:proteasome lid subunit RPN8/RPN11